MRRKGSSRSGFTLIEIMVVVIIIAALAGMVLPKIMNSEVTAKRKIAYGDLSSIYNALKLYRAEVGRYPSSQEGLNALMKRPGSAKKWGGPYIETEPVDPWGNRYEYRYPGTKGLKDCDLWSLGPDESDASDDICNWKRE